MSATPIKEKKYGKCTNHLFIAFGWLIVLAVTTLSVFIGVTHTTINKWNMFLYCFEPKFNKTVTPVARIWAVLTVIMLMVISVLMMAIKMITYNKFTKDVFNIANYFIGFLLSWDITYILQNLLSCPIPSYYTIEPLKQYFCSKNGTSLLEYSDIEDIDIAARGSFPSFLMCALCYTTLFFYLYACLLDNSKGIGAKWITLLIPGVITVAYAFLLWRNNENHLEDVLGGSVIGMFLAVYVMKDVLTKDLKFDRLPNNVSLAVSTDIEMNHLNPKEKKTKGSEKRVKNECKINLFPDVVQDTPQTPPGILQNHI